MHKKLHMFKGADPTFIFTVTPHKENLKLLQVTCIQNELENGLNAFWLLGYYSSGTSSCYHLVERAYAIYTNAFK